MVRARGCGAATSKADSCPRRGHLLHPARGVNGSLVANVSCPKFFMFVARRRRSQTALTDDARRASQPSPRSVG
jgi:hypothetical protein